MELEPNVQNTIQPERKHNDLSTVTPLSKVLAMLLFIFMPFVGGWVGYTYAPEKIIEVPVPVVEETKNDAVSDVGSAGENVYEWCIAHGGLDRTMAGFNAPLTCVVDNKVYEHHCLGNDEYFVIRESERYAPGNYVVKRKQTPEQEFACDYSVQQDDYEIQNEGADRLFALEGNHLFISSATGPGPAGLTIYDLARREVVFTDSWLGPASIAAGVLTYWRPTDIPATAENCAEFARNTEYGLGSAIDEQVTLDLQTLSVTPRGQERCTARQ